MITVRFLQHNGTSSGCTVSGHAGYGTEGDDIVCASVSSAVQITANTLTEILQIPAAVTAVEDTIDIRLPEGSDPVGYALLDGLSLHLELLKDDFPDWIQIEYTEV
jgi:uncharacterized protein YsxB (DUF464 family)